MRRTTRRGLLGAAACGLLALAACTKGGRVEDFTPPPDAARTALEAALKRWQDGQPPGTIPGTSPAVEAVDSKWKGGQQLKAFEVVKDEPAAGPGPRYFTVRLTPAKGSPQEVRYAVLGIDPIWVYREDDFKKLSGTGQ